MKWEWFNQLSLEEATDQLLKCCGCRRWAEAMAAGRPFRDLSDLNATALRVWESLDDAHKLEAFLHHPRIGDLASLKAKWASEEQGQVKNADEEILKSLALKNQEYEGRFGYLFLVCATGKSAEEMLQILTQRLPNEPDAEFRLACGEQAKITKLRMEKMLK